MIIGYCSFILLIISFCILILLIISYCILIHPGIRVFCGCPTTMRPARLVSNAFLYTTEAFLFVTPVLGVLILFPHERDTFLHFMTLFDGSPY